MPIVERALLMLLDLFWEVTYPVSTPLIPWDLCCCRRVTHVVGVSSHRGVHTPCVDECEYKLLEGLAEKGLWNAST